MTQATACSPHQLMASLSIAQAPTSLPTLLVLTRLGPAGGFCVHHTLRTSLSAAPHLPQQEGSPDSTLTQGSRTVLTVELLSSFPLWPTLSPGASSFTSTCHGTPVRLADSACPSSVTMSEPAALGPLVESTPLSSPPGCTPSAPHTHCRSCLYLGGLVHMS